MSRETNIDLICTLKKRGVEVSLRDNKAELLRKMGQSARKASPKPKAKPKTTPKTSSSSTPKPKKKSTKSKSPSSRSSHSNGMTRSKLSNHLKELIIRYVSDVKTIDDLQIALQYIAHKMRDDIKAMGAIDTFDYQSIWDEIEEHLDNLSEEWRMLDSATRQNFEWIFLDRVSSNLYDTNRRHEPKSSKPKTPMRESSQHYDVTNEDELSNHILHLVQRNVMSLKTLQDFEDFAIYMADELRYDLKTMGVKFTKIDYRSLWGEITDLLIRLSVPYVDLEYDDQKALLKLFVKRISM